jgi:Iron-containing redox enzyme
MLQSKTSQKTSMPALESKSQIGIRLNVDVESLPLFRLVNSLLPLDAVEIDNRLEHDAWRRHTLMHLAKGQVRKAYSGAGHRKAELDVQITLSSLLKLRLSKSQTPANSAEGSMFLESVEVIIERGMLASFHDSVPPEVVAIAPADPLNFQQYVRRLIKQSRAFDHPFYTDFLAQRATVQNIKAFLEAEMSIDGRFDDLMALAQIGFCGPAKVVMGDNYWDELGRGNPVLMHTVLFEHAMAEVGADIQNDAAVPIEAYEAGNLAVILASRRRYSSLALGFLAATEFLVPHRFQCFMEGWLRNGLSEGGAVYHREHIGVDGVHSRDWFEKVIGPEVKANPTARFDIARGVIFRLRNSMRYLDALLNQAVYRDLQNVG